ncbi:SurA N-terminal domain-containing protein [Aquisalimonas sp.]|uniref:SurA N-terminal domain-containing protein n=1 Tax=Aquisalimonas sp. TaxID=1872621 RepID=UPI0025BF76CA|nr:SurA N-terminal domain-containing protein [Aquisalimonas sp.]
MLQSIRDRATGWIAWVVIILIGAAFALFGLSNYMGPGGTPRVVATVDGTEIGRDQVGQVYRSQRDRIEQIYGDDLEITDAIDRQIRREALEQIINERLVAEYIDDRNLTLRDQDLAAIIRSQEMFHVDGRFSQERYQALLQANRMTTTQYEQQVRRQALSQQVQSALSETGLVTDREIDKLLRLQTQERDVAWLRLDTEAWLDDVSVTDADIQAYHDEHADDFVTPERVRLAYVELRREDMLDGVDVSDEEIETRYEQVKDERYAEEGEVEARHILIRVDDDASEDAVADAERRIRELRERILEGESFAELAAEYSEDPGSAARGGDLGQVERGDMVEPFEEVLFALEEEELSEPVRSPFGFHLIEATTASHGDVTPLEDVREELRREIAEERVNTEYFAELNRLDELAYDMPDSLDDVAESLGLEVRESDWITRDGAEEGLGSVPEVLEAAFGMEVLEDRMNSPVIEIDDDRAVVVRIQEHEPAEQLSVDDARDEIEQRLRTRKAREAADAFAEEVTAKLHDGGDAQALAEEDDRVSYESVGWISRDGGGAPWPVLERVFRMPRPDNGLETGVISAADDRVVVMLRGVREGDLDAMDPDERQELADRLRAAYGEEAVAQFLAQLRADADVEIHDEDYQ